MTKKNPFTISPIKEKEEFIGRKDLIDQVADMLSIQQCCHIIGERKSGKTSFLYRIAEEFKERGDIKFIFLDMQRLRSYGPEEILGRIAHLIDADLPEKEMDHREFENLISGKQVILAFDEIAAILESKRMNSDFFDFLRALSTNSNVAYLTTHTDELYGIAKNVSSPFFNYFRNFYLEYFTEKESKELIRKGGVEFLNNYGKWIIEKAYYHPFLLQLISLVLFEYYEEKKEEEYMFSNTEKEVYRTLKGHFEYWYDKSSGKEQNLLRRISRKEHISAEEESAISNLKRRLLIYKKNDKYYLVSPFFERTIKLKKEKEMEEKKKEKESNSSISSLIDKIEKSWPFKIIIIVSVILGILAAILSLIGIIH